MNKKIINLYIIDPKNYNLLITILNPGILQIILVFGISILVAFVSSFVPVYFIANKRPIDAINNR